MAEHSTPLDFGINADAYPLNEPIILRAGIALFESQLAAIPTSSADCDFLSSIVFGTCFSGASDFPIYPFVCAPQSPLTDPVTAAEVLAQLRITNFQSDHIDNFDSMELPYPGYHPGTKNDEIHTDPSKQYMFSSETDDDEQDIDYAGEEELSRTSHAALQSYVLNQKLFYVLVHDKPRQHGEFMFSDLVLLFSVGVSPTTGNLVGAVSCQVCHNLCD